MPRQHAKRCVLVTGGSRGLCLAIAQKLTSAGYRTIALARKKNEEIAEAMAQAERAEQGALHFVPFDLGMTDGISALVGDLRQLRSPFSHVHHSFYRCMVFFGSPRVASRAPFDSAIIGRVPSQGHEAGPRKNAACRTQQMLRGRDSVRYSVRLLRQF
jgi:NAD(P)-dependent dehydrogenase (short-subunit alcohol dehydrogenase family)